MSRNLNMGGNYINNVHDPVDLTDGVPKQCVDDNYVKKIGDTMSGDLNMGGHSVINLGAPSIATDATTKGHVDDNYVKKIGYVMPGGLVINNSINNATLMGCSNLPDDKSFMISMGDSDNQILYTRHNISPGPIYFLTSAGAVFELGSDEILTLGTSSTDKRILAHQPITLFEDPIDNHEATTKQYVDNERVCNSVGLIPQLISDSSNRIGYIASASSEYNSSYQAYNAFNFGSGVGLPVLTSGLLAL